MNTNIYVGIFYTNVYIFIIRFSYIICLKQIVNSFTETISTTDTIVGEEKFIIFLSPLL